MSPALQAWVDGGQLLRWNGHRVFFRRAGDGPALLLVHGFPLGSYDWQPVWDALAARFNVITLDLLGHGHSDKPRGHPYGVASHADLVEALLARLGVARVHVVAHDLGVSVVQELLARREADGALPRIDSVLFFNGGLCPQVYRPRLLQRLLASPLGPWLGPRVSRGAFERAIGRLFAPHAQPSRAQFDDFWHLVTRGDGLAVTHAVGAFWRDRRALSDRLVGATLRYRGPLRLVNGAADPNSGRHMAEAYRRLQPDADIVSLAGVGHWPQFEQPRVAADAVIDFVRPA